MDVHILVKPDPSQQRVHAVAPEHMFLPPFKTPIARISADILYEIFELIVLSDYGPTDSLPLSRTALRQCTSWLAITYVCRFWRNLALNSPRFWVYITLDDECSPNMLREFLRRSRQSVLSIIFAGPTKDKSISLSTVEDLRYMAGMCSVCSHRIGSLYISQFTQLQTSHILSPFRRAAHQLRTLVVSALRVHTTSPEDASLTTLFQGEMPLVHSIIVAQMTLPWRPYENLTRVLLMNQPLPSFSELIWTLRRCPSLDTLGLGLSGSTVHANFASYLTASSEGSEDVAPIEFPHLNNMILAAHHDVAAPLLRLLHYPPSSSTVLMLKHTPRSRVTSSHNAVAHVTRAALECYYIEESQILNLTALTCQPAVQVHWEWQEGVDAFEDPARMAHIADLVRFAGVQHLRIRKLQYPLYRQDWLHILAQMPALTAVELNSCIADEPTLFDALARTTTGPAGEPCLAVCPALAEFEFCEGHEYGMEALEAMVACFERRRELGAGLKLLKVALPRPPESYPEALMERMQEGRIAEKVQTSWPVESEGDAGGGRDASRYRDVGTGTEIHMTV